MFVEAICYCRLHINQGEDDLGVVVLAGIGPGSNFVLVITGEEEKRGMRRGGGGWNPVFGEGMKGGETWTSDRWSRQ